MKKYDIIDIANNISAEDMCTLIGIFAPKIDIFYGSANAEGKGFQISSGLSIDVPACMNGAIIQINSEHTDSDSQSFDDYLRNSWDAKIVALDDDEK